MFLGFPFNIRFLRYINILIITVTHYICFIHLSYTYIWYLYLYIMDISYYYKPIPPVTDLSFAYTSMLPKTTLWWMSLFMYPYRLMGKNFGAIYSAVRLTARSGIFAYKILPDITKYLHNACTSFQTWEHQQWLKFPIFPYSKIS